jgi:thiol-disulfide isomerase/thioredoxin
MLALAIVGCGAAAAPNAADYPPFKPPAGQPRALVALQDQAHQILPGGLPAFQKRLAALKGYPVVVNKWASWCGPCAAEFPYFAQVAQKDAGQVAFMGVDSMDDSAAAATFLDSHPVPFPSYSDPDTKISQDLKSGVAWPSTSFYDANGKFQYTKQGAYANEQLLVQDIERYALGNDR